VATPAQVVPLPIGRGVRGEVQPWRLAQADAPASVPAEIPEAELTALREQAMADGMQRGLEAGRELAARELSSARDRMLQAIERVMLLERGMLEAWRGELAELALEIAQAVTQRELASAKAWIGEIAGKAMAALGDEVGPWTITIAASDEGELGTAIASRWPDATVRSDASLRPGDVHIQSSAGSIESRLRERMATARRVVLGCDPTAPESDDR
jgi:flagellar biosynthesis/type III secretory pathway protein FliH